MNSVQRGKKRHPTITVVRLILCKLSVHIANRRMEAKSSAPIFHLSFDFYVVTIHKSKLVTATVYGFYKYWHRIRRCTRDPINAQCAILHIIIIIDATHSYWKYVWHEKCDRFIEPDINHSCCNIKWRTNQCARAIIPYILIFEFFFQKKKLSIFICFKSEISKSNLAIKSFKLFGNV